MQANQPYKFRARVWLYPGPGGWHFITLTKKLSGQIKFLAVGKKTALGSIRVSAVIGQTKWDTSLFPDTKAGAYLLPVKAAVRRKEKIETGCMVTVMLEIAD